MAVYLYFGLPGCGKTTLMASFANKFVNGKKYKSVYGNVHMKIPGYTYIDNECIGKYNLENAAILIDEATLFADSRAYKSFDVGKLMYFLEHRHFNVDIYLFTQQWDGVDRKIRVITDRVYYIYKGKILGHWWSTYYRIPYGIIIPDAKKKGASGEKLGEIIQGYCKPSLLIRLFAPKLYRPKYYKYFDSWEKYYLPPLPDTYTCYWPQKYSSYMEYMEDVRNTNLNFFVACSDRIYKLRKLGVDIDKYLDNTEIIRFMDSTFYERLMFLFKLYRHENSLEISK